MWLLLVILGLVGIFVPQQFEGQEPLSISFLILGAVIFLVQMIALALAARVTRSAWNQTQPLSPYSSRNTGRRRYP